MDTALIIDPVGIKAGMDYYDLNLAESMAHNGIPTYIASNFLKNEFCLKFFNSEKKQSQAAKLIDLVSGFTRSISFAKRKQIKYIIVHVFSTEAKDLLSFSLVKAAGLKLIVIAHDISGFANADSPLIKNIIFNNYADIIIVHNNYSFNALKAVVSKNAIQKTRIIPHGSFINLSLSHVSKESARKSLNISANEKVILFFGQIKRVKGLDVLINALPWIQQDICLVIAGKPWKDSFENYQNLIEKQLLTNRVRLFIRYIQDEERELFFKSADLLIIPYRNIYQSGVLLMGMSYNLPVLASDIEANRELVQHGINGILFKNGDSKDLSEKINEFFLTKSKQDLASRAYEIMKERHDWNSIAMKYKQVINEDSNNWL